MSMPFQITLYQYISEYNYWRTMFEGKCDMFVVLLHNSISRTTQLWHTNTTSANELDDTMIVYVSYVRSINCIAVASRQPTDRLTEPCMYAKQEIPHIRRASHALTVNRLRVHFFYIVVKWCDSAFVRTILTIILLARVCVCRLIASLAVHRSVPQPCRTLAIVFFINYTSVLAGRSRAVDLARIMRCIAVTDNPHTHTRCRFNWIWRFCMPPFWH